MEEIKIYKFQLEAIKDTLRLTVNINNCRGKETSFDRSVMQSVAFVDNALKGEIDTRVNRI